MTKEVRNPMELWLAPNDGGFDNIGKEVYDKWGGKGAIHLIEVIDGETQMIDPMTDVHLMKNLVIQSEIIAELKADNKIMKEALENILNCMHDYEAKYFSQDSCVIAANVSRADIALSKLKVKYD